MPKNTDFSSSKCIHLSIGNKYFHKHGKGVWGLLQGSLLSMCAHTLCKDPISYLKWGSKHKDKSLWQGKVDQSEQNNQSF